jgi:hypothetical protein
MTRAEETRVQQVQTETTHHTETRKQTHTQSTESTAAPKALSGIPVAKSFEKEPLQPPKKRFVPPLKLHQTPETSEAPKPRPYARKFKTPLMLAEERFRLQREKEEMENLKPTPPNSPPAHSEAPPTGERFLAGNAGETETLTTQSMQSTEAMVEERRAVAVEETSAHDAPVAKKLQSHIPSSKPLIAPLKKKSQQASSNITLDNKQGSRGHSSVVSGQRAQSSSDVFRESQTTQVSVSTAKSPPSPKPVDIL